MSRQILDGFLFEAGQGDLKTIFQKCKNFLLQQALVRASYHGQQHLKGNKSMMFLKRLDFLEKELSTVDYNKKENSIFTFDIKQLGGDILGLAGKYVKAFRSFYEVVKACFGQEVLPSFRDELKTFKLDYMALDISITPKV